MEALAIVGKRLPRVDALEKATGKAIYTPDVKLNGMLAAKILRSPHPHAKILNIDASRAEKLPGVKAVVTIEDTPKIKHVHLGGPFSDRYPLAFEKVRYVGEEIAGVAAIDEDTAEEAICLIDVEYELLPAVFDPHEAMKPGAPKIHDHVENNIACHRLGSHGDIEKGFAQADYIFEDHFEAPSQVVCFIEDSGIVAHFNIKGNLTVWTSTQSPYFIHKELSTVLGIPMSRIRIMEVAVGGGFGGKSKVCEFEACAALLSMKSGRPVRLILTREEEISASKVRHAIAFDLKTGVKKDGALTARKACMVVDNGAYNATGPSVASFASMILASLYRVPNVQLETFVVYTNKQVGGQFRGFGNPQATFAIESQFDIIAEKLNLDPVEIRLRNANKPGDVTGAGWRITSCGFAECIERAAAEIGWKGIKAMKAAGQAFSPVGEAVVFGPEVQKAKKGVYRGIGFGSLIHVSGTHGYIDGDFSSAVVQVQDDGMVTVFWGSADAGQGIATSLAQIAAEVLGVGLSDVRMVTMDTEKTPQDLGSWASRSCFIGGNAVRLAAEEAKKQVLEIAAAKLEASPGDLLLQDKKVFVAGYPTRSISLAEVIKGKNDYKIGRCILGKAHYQSPSELVNPVTGFSNISAAYTFGTQAAEVEVDPETGHVKVLKFVATSDGGRAINPVVVEGQLEGGACQGLGYALTEHLKYKDGRVLNLTLLDYKIPGAMDVPNIKTALVETSDPVGPFGAKGVGEPGPVPTAGAIANAVYNAVGVRIKELPLTLENVARALKAKSRPDPL